MTHVWTDTHVALQPQDQPIITTRDDRVNLHLPGYLLDGQGFSVTFTQAHLTMARTLVTALEALPPLGSDTDADPF